VNDEINLGLMSAILTSGIPNAIKKFDQKQLRLFDTSQLFGTVNKSQWLADLKDLRWYGPFTKGEDTYFFQTATSDGNFQGFYLNVLLDQNMRIYFNFLNRSS